MYVFPIKYKFVFPSIKLLNQNSLSITMDDGHVHYGKTKLNNKTLLLTRNLGSFIDHLLQVLHLFTRRQR